jgi:phage head maturation protease
VQQALIRFAPLVTEEVLRDPAALNPQRIYYQRGALRLLGDRPVPLLINHDVNRQVGEVTEFVELEEADGLWLYARATVTDPPEWLTVQRTKASFGFGPVERQRFGNLDRVLRGVVREVSILSPSRAPADELARVVLLRDRPAHRSGEPQPLRRYFPTHITVR